MKLRFKEFMEPLQGHPTELELPSLHDPAISAFKDHFILWDRGFSLGKIMSKVITRWEQCVRSQKIHMWTWVPMCDFCLFLCGSNGKESACNTGNLGLIPGSGRSPGEGNGNPLQYSCLENSTTDEPGRLQSMGSQKSWTLLSNLTTTIEFLKFILSKYNWFRAFQVAQW